MSFIVTYVENVQSDIPVGVEQGAHYVLTGPDGTRATFNNPDDIDHVGFLTEVPSGFDSADVRESSDLIVEGDGGVHGAFYFGRRPWTLTGIIDPRPGALDDPADEPGVVANRRITRLQRASRALREDAVLSWQAAGGVEVMLRARRQSGPRVTNRLPKAFQLAMVSAEPRIQSTAVKSSSDAGGTPLTIRNDGNTDASPVITLRDAWVDPILASAPTGRELRLDLTLIGGDELVIDAASKTVVLNGSTNVYDALIFPTSEWWDLEPGDNLITATGAGAGTWTIDHRDAWE